MDAVASLAWALAVANVQSGPLQIKVAKGILVVLHLFIFFNVLVLRRSSRGSMVSTRFFLFLKFFLVFFIFSQPLLGKTTSQLTEQYFVGKASASTVRR